MGRIIHSPGRAFLLLFVVAMSLRLLLLPFAHPEPENRMSLENYAVAANVARDGVWNDPYAVPSGPTSHPVPFYTAVIALSYRVFGVTPAAEYSRIVLSAAGFAVLYAMLPWVGLRFGPGSVAGFLGGLLGAVTPFHPPFTLWMGLGEEWVAVTMALLMAASLAQWSSERPSAPGALALGGGWGLAFHASPPLLPVMAGCLAFELAWRRGRRKYLLAALTLAGAAIACAPWTYRNYRAFHELIFIRGNFGLELRMGNHDGATADVQAPGQTAIGLHPRSHPEEAAKVRDWGEMAYMRSARREALDWIRRHPAQFATLSASRFLQFWFGPPYEPLTLTAWTLLTCAAAFGFAGAWSTLTTPQRAAILIPLLTFPLTYYFVIYMPRYRLPLDWLLLLLAGAGLQRLFRRA